MAQFVRTCVLRDQLGLAQTNTTYDKELNLIAQRMTSLFESVLGRTITRKTFGFSTSVENGADYYYFKEQPVVKIHKMEVSGETYTAGTTLADNVYVIDRTECNTAVVINEPFPIRKYVIYFSVTTGFTDSGATSMSISTVPCYSIGSSTFNVPAVIEEAIKLKVVSEVMDRYAGAGTSTINSKLAKGLLFIASSESQNGKIVYTKSQVKEAWDQAINVYNNQGYVL